MNDPLSSPLERRACRVGMSREQAERRGFAWLIGAFLLCPCHLPLTLGLAATVLAGTAIGAALHRHPIVAGTIITLAWLGGTWRGIHLLRAAQAYAARRERPDRAEGSVTCSPTRMET